MKKYFGVLLILVTIVAQAQTITQKDLQGQWVLSTVQIHGVILDFETGTVTVVPGEEGTYTENQLKKIAAGMKGPHPFPVSVGFLQDNKIEIITKGIDPDKAEVETAVYNLKQNDGHTTVDINKDKWEIFLQNEMLGFIISSREDDSDIVVNYKKAK